LREMCMNCACSRLFMSSSNPLLRHNHDRDNDRSYGLFPEVSL